MNISNLPLPTSNLLNLSNYLGKKVRIDNPELSLNGKIGTLVEVRAYALTFSGLINYETCQIIIDGETHEQKFHITHVFPL